MAFSDVFNILVRALSLYNILLTFTIIHTHFVLFQFHLNHQIDITKIHNQNLLALVESKVLIKEMQRAMVNLCNYDKSQVLGAKTTPQNNTLGGFLPQKLVTDVLKTLEC